MLRVVVALVIIKLNLLSFKDTQIFIFIQRLLYSMQDEFTRFYQKQHGSEHT